MVDGRTGAALPAVLALLLWLAAVSGWVLAHVLWDRRSAVVEDASATVRVAADTMAEAMTQEVGRVALWTDLTMPGPALPCPAGGPPLPAAIDVGTETARAQAALDAAGRWDAGMRPIWRFVTACHVPTLLGNWRTPVTSIWALAWVADDPDAPGAMPPTQLVLRILAVQIDGGRAVRTVTVRRHPGETWARIVSWRGG